MSADDFDFDQLLADAHGVSPQLVHQTEAMIDAAGDLYEAFCSEMGNARGLVLFLLSLARAGNNVIIGNELFGRYSNLHEHVAIPAMMAMQGVQIAAVEALSHYGSDGALVPLLAIFTMADQLARLIQDEGEMPDDDAP